MYIYLKKNVKSRIYSLDKEIKVKKKKLSFTFRPYMLIVMSKSTLKAIILNISQRSRTKTVHNKTFRPHLRYIFGISDNMTQHFWNVKSTFCQSYHITSFK